MSWLYFVREYWRPVVAFALPVPILIAWPLWSQVRIWRAQEPDRTVAAAPEIAYAACDDPRILASVDAVPLLDDLYNPKIPKSEAGYEADRIVAERHEWFAFGQPSLGNDPDLARLFFADGRERIVWYRTLVFDDDAAGAVGTADMILIDSNTGEALVMLTDITIENPQVNCITDRKYLPGLTGLLLPLGMLVGYLILLGVIGDYILARRRVSRWKAGGRE